MKRFWLDSGSQTFQAPTNLILSPKAALCRKHFSGPAGCHRLQLINICVGCEEATVLQCGEPLLIAIIFSSMASSQKRKTHVKCARAPEYGMKHIQQQRASGGICRFEQRRFWQPRAIFLEACSMRSPG